MDGKYLLPIFKEATEAPKVEGPVSSHRADLVTPLNVSSPSWFFRQGSTVPPDPYPEVIASPRAAKL